VINLSWDDAKAYTLWLSRKTGKKDEAAIPRAPVPCEGGVEISVGASERRCVSVQVVSFVAVLAPQKSRMDALLNFADLQQRYGDVLSTKKVNILDGTLQLSGEAGAKRIVGHRHSFRLEPVDRRFRTTIARIGWDGKSYCCN